MNKFINTILHYPKLVVLLFLSLACFSFFFTLHNLNIDTSTDSLINKNLDFKINQKRLKDEFKFLSNNILIRVSHSNQLVLDESTKKLIENLKIRKDLSFVYSPNVDPLFKENFFNFLNHKEKKKLYKSCMNINHFYQKLTVILEWRDLIIYYP